MLTNLLIAVGVVVGADDRQNLSDERGCEIIHYARLNIHDEVCAALSLLKRNMLHFRCRGALLRGERKRTDALELVFLQKVTELGKFRLALAGKAGDKARAEHKAWDLAAELGKQLLDVFAVSAAVHAAEDIVVDVLDRDIQILDDLRLVRQHVNQLL